MALFKFLFGRMNGEKSQTEDSVAEVSAIAPESAPAYTLRIATYDSMSILPRTIDLSSDSFASFVDEASSRVYAFCKEKGGSMPFVVLREAIENLIHAGFKDAVITIMPDGNVVRISDHGPGIPAKSQAMMPGFTSATADDRKLIKGVGSGFPIMIESLESLGGFLTVEDNLGSGLVVTLCSSPGTARGGVSPKPDRVLQKTAGPSQPVRHDQAQIAQGFTEAAWSSRQGISGAYHPPAQGIFIGHPQDGDGHIFAEGPGDARPQRDPGAEISQTSSAVYNESDSIDMENIADEGRATLSVEKQDSAADQSKKRRDEEPPSTSQSSDMSDEALGALLSSRQKKVFLLIAEMGEIGPSVVTKELDISLSTAYRDLVTLEELGLVVSLEGGKRKLTRRGVDFLSYVFR